jgi:L-alanine-DL-glutamate epimerase-like enolase superfamily enzyme
LKVTGTRSFLLRIPVGREIADSMQSVTHLEFAGLQVTTDAGITGTGYTVTVGHGGSVIREVIDSLFAGELIGTEPRNLRETWQALYFGKSHWIGRAGATTMAQSAVDIALWDINAKAAGLPLWQLLGGASAADVPIYNTHAGWLNYSMQQLTEEARRLLGQGYTALKMKVGLADAHEDRRRVEAVRKVVGDDVLLMVDANQKWDLIQARQSAKLLEGLGLGWLEEPLHPDDIRSHRQLARDTSIPIALGEHVYTTHAFRDYLEGDAVDVVQVDACRVGGITPWLEVAAMAHAFNVRVCPHAGDLMQVHQHLVKAIPNRWMLEVIPLWEQSPFQHPVRLERGRCLAPTEPGASTDFTPQAFEQFASGRGASP